MLQLKSQSPAARLAHSQVASSSIQIHHRLQSLFTMDHSTCQSPRAWPVGAVYGFCRDRSLDLTTAVNTAWAIVLWGYTGEEVIVFPSQSITHDTHTWHRCESVVDWTSTFSSVLRRVRNSTGQVSTPTADLPPSQGTPLLNTVTVFTSGSSCCTAPVSDAYLTGLVCNLSETTLDCAVRFVPGVIDTKQAERLASAFAHIMDLLLSGTDEMLASIDIVSDHDKAEVRGLPYPYNYDFLMAKDGLTDYGCLLAMGLE